MSASRRDLEFLRAAIAAGLLGTADVAWSAAAVCDQLEGFLDAQARATPAPPEGGRARQTQDSPEEELRP